MATGAAEVVPEAYWELQDELRTTLGTANDADCAAAMEMVWWRCRDLADWFRMRLGVI